VPSFAVAFPPILASRCRDAATSREHQRPSVPHLPGRTEALGAKRGVRIQRVFHLRRCRSCTFAFVADPWTDYAAVYDDSYYVGQGADPMVNYGFEYDHPTETIRRYDWIGIEEFVTALHPAPGSWLDYGCGNGALVRSVAAGGRWSIVGFDTGSWSSKARDDGLPILTEPELAARRGPFDVITAIEVIEHIADPVGFLTRLRSLARPGTLLFLTTLNAQVAPRDFPSWSYVRPEIHVSFFTPKALARALEKSGFSPRYVGFAPGWSNMIRFKVMKNVGIRRIARWQALVPWPAIGRLVDARYQVTGLPVGLAI